jgi:hypothetical protein
MGDLRTTLLPYHGSSLIFLPWQFDEDMFEDWTQSLPACRRCLRAAKGFAVANAGLEKISLSFGYSFIAAAGRSHVLSEGHPV